jgi:predicted DNA-binding transcriptional regulator AlpA
MATATNVEPLSMTIAQFCKAHSIGRTTLWKMWREGKGPRRFRVGRLVRIPVDEARHWRGETDVTAGGEA